MNNVQIGYDGSEELNVVGDINTDSISLDSVDSNINSINRNLTLQENGGIYNVDVGSQLDPSSMTVFGDLHVLGDLTATGIIGIQQLILSGWTYMLPFLPATYITVAVCPIDYTVLSCGFEVYDDEEGVNVTSVSIIGDDTCKVKSKNTTDEFRYIRAQATCEKNF